MGFALGAVVVIALGIASDVIQVTWEAIFILASWVLWLGRWAVLRWKVDHATRH